MRARGALIVVLLVGAALRVVAAVNAVLHDVPRRNSDTFNYLLSADMLRKALAEGHSAGNELHGLFVRAPLYPIFLLVLNAGRERWDVPVIVAQVVLSIATIWVTYRIGSILLDRLTGVIAAGMVALLPSQIDLSTTLMTEALRGPLVAFTVLALLRFGQQPDWRRALVAGLLTALLGVSHSTAFLLPVPLLGWAALRSIRHVLVLAAPPVIAVLLWVSGSRVIADRVILPGQGGEGWGSGGAWTAYVGSRPWTAGRLSPGDRDMTEPTRFDRLRARVAQGDPKVPAAVAEYVRTHEIDALHRIPDEVFWAAYLAEVRGDVLGFVSLTLSKGRLLMVGPWLETQWPAQVYPIPREVLVPLHCLALVGLLWPRRPPWVWSRVAVAIVPAYVLAVSALTYPEARYWWPVLPLVVVLAAVPSARAAALAFVFFARSTRAKAGNSSTPQGSSSRSGPRG